MSFVHLHNHTEYSLLDGAVRVRQLVASAKAMGMPAVAITDHGFMYGVVDAVLAGMAAGVKVLVGCEVYVAPRSLYDKDAKSGDDEPSHLVLLAQTSEGYRNLSKLVSVACVDGFYYKPRIDRDLLRQHSAGLIGMSACVFGEIPRLVLGGDARAAQALALEYSEILDGRFYLELQRHGLRDEDVVNPHLIRISRETGIPLVATNDVHYVAREDARFHDVMLCMQTGKRVTDPGRMRFPNDQFYLKTSEEMERLFEDVPEAVHSTLSIAESCDVALGFGEYHLPSFPLRPGQTADSLLRELCTEGLASRYGASAPEAHARLADELAVIASMGFSSYFLVVWDFIRWAREQGIAVGPGRGSAAGSIVTYALRITDIDPLRYGLLFERFLNPERITMPDIDIDFDDRRRGEVIGYVTRTYGSDRVAQITTFGTLKARSAIRDVARALDMPLSKADRLAKLVPYNAPTVSGILATEQSEPSLRELAGLYSSDPEVRELLDCAKFVEGLPRHASIHAAGVVITDEPVSSLVPLARSKDGGSNVTQFTMGALEKLGLLKIDFLGLSNLNVIRDTLDLVARHRGQSVTLPDLPLDDRKTMQLFSTGQTIGVFQFESSGMRQMLQEFRPQRFEDLGLLNAAYRPGPMQMIPTICDVRHGRKEAAYAHPILVPILQGTYGAMIYQEQVMQIAKAMAGFSLGRADLLRRAMSKKQKDVMARERVSFVEGSTHRGVDASTAEQVYDLIARFAEYGFPQPHAIAYALIAFQTAYLKAHYPEEFMAAKLTSEKGNAGKVALYVAECKRLGVPVRTPDVNLSGVDFEPVSKGVLFGLSAIRNVGEGAAAEVVKAREAGPFTCLSDLCSRTGLNKRELESLVRSGACSSFGRRSQLLAVLDSVVKRCGQGKKGRAREENQWSLLAHQMFPDAASAGFTDDLPGLDELPPRECMALEKEYLGLYVSGHPLDGLAWAMAARGVVPSAELGGAAQGARVTVAGVVTAIRRITTKKGSPMAFVTIEDHLGSIEVIVFPMVYAASAALLKEEAVIFCTGKNDSLVSGDDDDAAEPTVEAKVLADAIDAPDAVLGGVVTVALDKSHGADVMTSLSALLRSSRGDTPVYLRLADGSSLLTSRDSWITPSPELMTCIEAMVGKRNCSWTLEGQTVSKAEPAAR